jgi:hypothetical protein
MYIPKIEKSRRNGYISRHNNWSKLNQEVIRNQTRSIVSREIKAVINSLSTKRNPELDRFTAEFCLSLKN